MKNNPENQMNLCSPWVALAIAALANWALSAQAESPGVHMEMLSRHVAVTNVCAWPKLTLLPNGDIAAALYNQPSHGRLPGDVECWVSSDGGRTWEHRGRATAHQPNTSHMNHAIGVAGNGDLLIVAGGWRTLRPDRPKGELLRPIVSRSSDDGRTWTAISQLPDAPNGMTLVPFGNVMMGADGHLRVSAFTFMRGANPRVDTCYVMLSEDNGFNWRVHAVVGTPEANETHLAHLGDGIWLAAARNLQTTSGRNTHSIDLYRSQDDARNWRLVDRITKGGQHPGHLLKLADGPLLLTYGDRSRSPRGIGVRVSNDQGDSWSDAVLIVEGLGGDAGYPTTVELEDGTLVTAYYSSRSDDYDGYHMGTVRWRLTGPTETAAH